MNSSFGTRPRSALKRKNMVRGTPTAKSGFRGGSRLTPTKSPFAMEEAKRPTGVAADFERKATDFFKSK